MRKDITVVAESRSTRGKNEARRLRVTDKSPAVVYGAGKEPVPVAISPKELNRILRGAGGHNTIFNLDIPGMENTPVMIVDWQRDPVTEKLLHADLKRIDLAKKLYVKVAVHFVGEPVGVKLQGGLLEVVNREFEIECLPDDIPEHFSVDIAHLNLNQAVRAGDVGLTEKMTLVSHADLVLVHVVGAKAEEVAAPVEGAVAPTTAEPEVIKKGKKEVEGEAAKPGAKAPAGKAAPAAKAPAPEAKKKK